MATLQEQLEQLTAQLEALELGRKKFSSGEEYHSLPHSLTSHTQTHVWDTYWVVVCVQVFSR